MLLSLDTASNPELSTEQIKARAYDFIYSDENISAVALKIDAYNIFSPEMIAILNIECQVVMNRLELVMWSYGAYGADFAADKMIEIIARIEIENGPFPGAYQITTPQIDIDKK